jgi:hypothetical protein
MRHHTSDVNENEPLRYVDELLKVREAIYFPFEAVVPSNKLPFMAMFAILGLNFHRGEQYSRIESHLDLNSNGLVIDIRGTCTGSGSDRTSVMRA